MLPPSRGAAAAPMCAARTAVSCRGDGTAISNTHLPESGTITAQPGGTKCGPACKEGRFISPVLAPSRLRRAIAIADPSRAGPQGDDWPSHAADSFRYLALPLDRKATQTGCHRRIEYTQRGVVWCPYRASSAAALISELQTVGDRAAQFPNIVRAAAPRGLYESIDFRGGNSGPHCCLLAATLRVYSDHS